MLPSYEQASALFARYELELSQELYEKLDAYAAFLVEYNEKVNLTAITAPEEILVKHFLDSLLLIRYVDLPQGASLLDVGSGAGFPSVPILLARPDLKLTLLDSLQKRITFLQTLGEKLGFSATYLHTRAEEAGRQPQLREQFDVVTARAVAAMSPLCEYCMPFVKVGGMFAAMKGPSESIANAAHAIGCLGGKAEPEVLYPLEIEQRKPLRIRKISQTSTKYPRNSGQIKSKPL